MIVIAWILDQCILPQSAEYEQSIGEYFNMMTSYPYAIADDCHVHEPEMNCHQMLKTKCSSLLDCTQLLLLPHIHF